MIERKHADMTESTTGYRIGIDVGGTSTDMSLIRRG